MNSFLRIFGPLGRALSPAQRSPPPDPAALERARLRAEAERFARLAAQERLSEETAPEIAHYLRAQRRGYTRGSLPRDRLERTIREFEGDRD